MGKFAVYSIKKLFSQEKVRHGVAYRGAHWGGGGGRRLEYIDVLGEEPEEIRVSSRLLAGSNEEGVKNDHGRLCGH